MSIRGAHFAVVGILLVVVTANADMNLSKQLRRESDVHATYDALSAVGPAARRAIFSDLAAEMQRDLWILHLTNYLHDHPALTAEQRSILYEAIGFLSIEAPGADARLNVSALDSLRLLTERARSLFTPDAAHAILEELGTPASSTIRFTPDVHDLGTACECSTESDWCGWGTVCIGGIAKCRPVQGCGTFWQYACDGLCGP